MKWFSYITYMKIKLLREIDPKIPEISYFVGFITGDGNLSKGKNKAKLTIEISNKDREILEKFQKIIEGSNISERDRRTIINKREYNGTFSCFAITRLETCNRLNEIGIPYGKKCEIAGIPKEDYSIVDFWRGIIDADGSLGMTNNNIPFISLVTKSENLAESFKDFVYSITNYKPSTRKNNRDGVYNIMLSKEKAQLLVEKLYYDNCLCLSRKKNKADIVLSWRRPSNMRVVKSHFTWNESADKIILDNPTKDSMKILNLGRSAITCRKRRLKQQI